MDGVHVGERLWVPFDQVHDGLLPPVHVANSTGPAAKRDVRKVRVGDALLDPDGGPNRELQGHHRLLRPVLPFLVLLSRHIKFLNGKRLPEFNRKPALLSPIILNASRPGHKACWAPT